jgi:deoxyadenosine/deoxycytidine kinase
MKIGLCGTMSVGKTTLVKALAKTTEFKNYKTATERSKYLRDLGIPLNTDSTVNGQFVFLAERASELLHENILTDRTIWDVCSFTMLAKSIGTHEKSQFVNAAMTLREQYDVVFYIEPVGVEMEDNGVRETNLEYRADINQEILRLLTLFPPKKLVILHGSTKDRVKTVLDALK